MTPRSFEIILVRDVDLTALNAGLAPLFQTWSDKWLPLSHSVNGLEFGLRHPTPLDQAPDIWQLEDGTDWWQGHGTDLLMHLGTGILGHQTAEGLADDDWALAAARKAMAELKVSLLQYFGCPAISGRSVMETVAPSHAYRGSVVLELPRFALRWLLPSEVWRKQITMPSASVSQTAPICSITKAVGTRSLSLEVGLDEVEITIDDLLGLRTGDVITFQKKLTEPLSLSLSGHHAPLKANLGRQEEQFVIQITDASKASPSGLIKA